VLAVRLARGTTFTAPHAPTPHPGAQEEEAEEESSPQQGGKETHTLKNKKQKTKK
jgi:hypothetical protein